MLLALSNAEVCYVEDSAADVDMNVVMQDAKNFIEVQGTGEHASFDRAMLNTLLDLGENACKEIYKKQMELIGGELP